MFGYACFAVLMFVPNVLSITTEKCYQCNSMVEPDCEKTDLDVLKKFVKVCSPEDEIPPKNTTPIACRKIVQSIESMPQRTIRECAYTGNPNLDGMRKQGNKGIKMMYYQCENTDNETPCNECSKPLFSLAGFVALAFLLMRT